MGNEENHNSHSISNPLKGSVIKFVLKHNGFQLAFLFTYMILANYSQLLTYVILMTIFPLSLLFF